MSKRTQRVRSQRNDSSVARNQIAELSGRSATIIGLVVIPVVMDDRNAIRQAMKVYNVTTPFLLDNGAVSAAYKTLGTGMRAGSFGHGLHFGR